MDIEQSLLVKSPIPFEGKELLTEDSFREICRALSSSLR
jgi:hypothetical protein